MARPKKENYLSPMRRHRRKGRQDTARCTLIRNGVKEDVYLGLWGSEDAEAQYQRIKAEYDGQTLAVAPPDRDSVTMAYLFDKFLDAQETRWGALTQRQKDSERGSYLTVIRHTMELYADLPVKDFNCTAYRNVRQYLVRLAPRVEGNRKKPWSRNYVVKLIGFLRRILHWGVSHDIVSYDVVAKLKYVEPLEAPELEVKPPRQDVPDEVIKATLPYLTSVVRDMVIIQRGNGLRPSEVCNIQVKDIDTSADQWTLTKKGKTTKKTGIPLVVFFSLAEQEIIRRRIAGKKPNDYLFTPEESERERQGWRSENRRTPHTPSSLADKREREKRPKKFNPHYDASSYYHAIQYAIRKANQEGVMIPHWTPYQIRHTAVTEVAYRNDRQTAAFLAGHMHVSTTNRYAHEMVKVKSDLAKKRTVYK